MLTKLVQKLPCMIAVPHEYIHLTLLRRHSDNAEIRCTPPQSLENTIFYFYMAQVTGSFSDDPPLKVIRLIAIGPTLFFWPLSALVAGMETIQPAAVITLKLPGFGAIVFLYLLILGFPSPLDLYSFYRADSIKEQGKFTEEVDVPSIYIVISFIIGFLGYASILVLFLV